MLQIQEIAAALTCSRTEFARVFLQAQGDLLIEQRVDFEAITRKAVDVEAYVDGLTFANSKGFLDQIIDIVVAESLENGKIARSIADEATVSAPVGSRLHAIANAARGFDDPDVVYRGVVNGMRWTTRVLIGGQAVGTGILISPNLVLTAWHVVRALFTPYQNGRYNPNEDGTGLQFEFDNFLELVNRGRSFQAANSMTVSAHTNWYIDHSECHPQELTNEIPDELEGYWDYAIIKLDKAPGLERRWLSPDARAVVPKPSAKIVVFQHPNGQPMVIGDSLIVEAEAALRNRIPRMRFLHGANALPGSSGGPCFDKTFALFGLHQGQWSAPSPGGQILNRGVPLTGIIEDYRALPAPDPAEMPIWNISESGRRTPILGTMDFQQLIWQSAINGSPKLITIRGIVGSGKTFRLSVLGAMLLEGGHLRIDLRAELIAKLEAKALATTLCDIAGASQPEFGPPESVDSTTTVWLKGELIDKVMAALDKVRGSRLVWITISNLNAFEIEGDNASQFLLLLYEETIRRDWLRIVLDGMKGDLPTSFAPEHHRVASITKDDIHVYLERLIAELDLPVPQKQLDAFTQLLWEPYQDTLIDTPEKASAQLATETMRFAQALIDVA